MQVLTTPPDVLERLAALPDFPWPPEWVTVAAGLRMAVVDAGPRDAPVVVCLHGEPSWSYLYRHVARRLVESGLRVVLPDLVGFGRSDKPTDVADHSYAGHVEWLRVALFDRLALTDVTLLCQDWGGLLGLRLVAEHPERFAAVVAANTGLPTGEQRMPEAWVAFRDFVVATPDLPIGFLVSHGVVNPMPADVVAAYEAPFPDATFKAGPRALPLLIPTAPDAPGGADNRAAWASLAQFDRPFVTAFSDADPITRGADVPLRERIPGAATAEHATVHGAGHFLQEDRPDDLAAVVLRVVRGGRG